MSQQNTTRDNGLIWSAGHNHHVVVLAVGLCGISRKTACKAKTNHELQTVVGYPWLLFGGLEPKVFRVNHLNGGGSLIPRAELSGMQFCYDST